MWLFPLANAKGVLSRHNVLHNNIVNSDGEILGRTEAFIAGAI